MSLSEVTTSSPSLNHSILGFGFPSALQLSVTGSFLATTMSEGCSVILGDLNCAEIKEENRLAKQKKLYRYNIQSSKKSDSSKHRRLTLSLKRSIKRLSSLAESLCCGTFTDLFPHSKELVYIQ